MSEKVDGPAHYGGKDNPLEVIKIIEYYKLGFNLGNTVKYVLRAENKGDLLTDLRKGLWYLEREVKNLEKQCAQNRLVEQETAKLAAAAATSQIQPENRGADADATGTPM